MNTLAVLYTAWSHPPTCTCPLCLQAAAMLPAEDERARYVVRFLEAGASVFTETVMEITVESLEREIDEFEMSGATEITVRLADSDICVYAEGEWYPTKPLASETAKAD